LSSLRCRSGRAARNTLLPRPTKSGVPEALVVACSVLALSAWMMRYSSSYGVLGLEESVAISADRGASEALTASLQSLARHARPKAGRAPDCSEHV